MRRLLRLKIAIYDSRNIFWIVPFFLAGIFQLLGLMNIKDWIFVGILHFFGLSLVFYDNYLLNKRDIKELNSAMEILKWL